LASGIELAHFVVRRLLFLLRVAIHQGEYPTAMYRHDLDSPEMLPVPWRETNRAPGRDHQRCLKLFDFDTVMFDAQQRNA
jgi:hypothetical protein